MPYLVNNQPVPEELVSQEAQRLSRDLTWQNIPDETERARRLHAAAEQSAIDRILVQQAAAGDPRPIDAAELEGEVERQKAQWGCRSAFDDTALRQAVELQLRVERTTREMTAAAERPSAQEVEDFYRANRVHFQKPEMFRAAHVVKHVNGGQGEDQARAGIEAALAELERGEAFAEVAERHSDCKGNGGDLGEFPAGCMVQEFEDAIRALEPGRRSGVFRTPFGFHIALLHARTLASPAGFEDVRADIERVFLMRNQHEHYLRAVTELRTRATIRWAAGADGQAS